MGWFKSHRTTLEAIVLAVVCFGVYQYSVPRSFNTVYENRRFFDSDGEFIVRQFDQGRTFTHNDHLLYHVTARFLHQHPHLLGLGTKPVRIHLFLSSLFGALAVGLAYGAGVRTAGSRPLALAVALACGGCAGWWFFSATIDTYMPCLFFCLLSLVLALRTLEHPSLLLHAGLGVSMGLAFLFRTDSFLLATLGLIYLHPRNRKSTRLLACGIPGLLVAAGGYAVFAHAAYGVPWSDVPRWALGGMERPESHVENTWGQWANLAPGNLALALVNQCFYAVLLPGLEGTRDARVWAMYPPAAWATAGFVLCSLLLALARFSRDMGASGETGLNIRLAWGLALSWMLVRTVFYAWWDPFDPFLFAVMSLPAMWVVMLYGAAAFRRRESTPWGQRGVTAWFGLLAAVIVLHNLGWLILPLRRLAP